MKIFLISIFLLVSFQQVKAQGIDLRLLESINGAPSGADKTWRDVSKSTFLFISITPMAMLIDGLATNNTDVTVKAFETGGSILIAEGVSYSLKGIVHRERPYLAHPNLIYGKSTPTDGSFPSGHASVAFAAATSLSLSFPKWYVIAPSFAYASAVGYSRMYLGVHYPSDVLAGAIIGAGSSFLTWKLQKLLNKKYHYTGHQSN
jgi:membrane-associated phospholipid phosphatase